MGKPKIRFKGFDDDWEQRKWMNSVDISTEMVDPASGEYDDMPHIAPGNIESFTGRILDNVRTVKEEQLISGKFRFRPDDVVYGKINPQLGKYFYASVDGLTSADAYVFKGKNGIRQKFLFSMLQTSDFFKYSVSVSKRSGMPKINRDELNAYAFLAPSEEEQDKIGNFLLEIDHLITLHQRKCDETKKLKKYMLQKMFPQNGQTVPEIRFSGFTDVWEQRKLGEITVKIGSGKTPSGGKSAYVETGIPLIRSQNVNNDKVDFADVVYIDKSTDESMSNSRVYTNDVLLNITGASIGRSAVYKGVESANVNQHVCIIRQIEGYQSDFIQLNLSSDNGQKQIDASQAGGGREGLNFQEIGKMQFSFPTLNEQKCIGRYFNNLDHLITLHQQKCDELRNIKKFMLQNMFA